MDQGRTHYYVRGTDIMSSVHRRSEFPHVHWAFKGYRTIVGQSTYTGGKLGHECGQVVKAPDYNGRRGCGF